MTNTSIQKLHDDFFKIVETGTEQEAKDFLVEHLKEFPQKEQDEIIMSFLEDAVTKQAADAATIADFQKKGLETFDGVVKEKKKLEDKAKLLEIKETI